MHHAIDLRQKLLFDPAKWMFSPTAIFLVEFFNQTTDEAVGHYLTGGAVMPNRP